MYKINLVIALVIFSVMGLFSGAQCRNKISPTVLETVPSNGTTNVAADQNLEVYFSERITPKRINRRTFVLLQNGCTEPIRGKRSYSPRLRKVTFNPTQVLAENAEYTFTIGGKSTLGPNVKDRVGNRMKDNYVWSFRTGQDIGSTSDISLTVSETNPENDATNVVINSKIIAIFNDAVSGSINSNTVAVSLMQGTTVIDGTVSYLDKSIIFTPTNNFELNSPYTATITTQVLDQNGNSSENDYVWSFRTGQDIGSTSDISLTVSETNPEDGSVSVAINSKVIAIFNDAVSGSINSSTVAFSLMQGTTVIDGTVSYLNKSVIFTPTNSLGLNSPYTATITTQVLDQNGNSSENDYVWSFTTNSIFDNISPTVEFVSPVNGSIDIATEISLGANFNEALDPSTISATSFVLRQGTTLIPGTTNYFGTTATFNPTNSLVANSTYMATITTDVTDLIGNQLANDFVWSFKTEVIPTNNGNQMSPVNLASTSNYAILAGSTVTSTGPSVVTGDLGLSPGSALTGFPPATLDGTQHISDTAAAQAKLDLTTAYNNAAGRSNAPITVSGNLGGQTLTPGLYKSTSTLAISSGDLTLDAQGDANAVFIFQIASSLTVTSGRAVILSGGAQAANIFWQVGSSATFGTSSVFKGNILVDQSISFDTGASLEGRALTRIGAVTLDSAIITKP